MDNRIKRHPFMRIVFIQKTAGAGGAKVSLLGTLRCAREHPDIQCKLVTSETGSFNSRAEELGFQPIIAPLPEWRKWFQRLRFPRSMNVLAERLREFAPDYVISNEMWWAPHALSLAMRLDCRSACIIRDTLAAGPKARQYRLAELHRTLCVSRAMEDALKQSAGPWSNMRVVYNPVFPPALGPAETDSPLKEFPRVSKWLLVVGHVGERKNQIEAVRTLGRLHEAGLKNCGLVLAGSVDKDYLPKLREAISQLKLEQFVCVAGQVEPIGNLVQQCEATLLTSTREGLPRAIIESLLLGKPCFSSPLPGLDEIYGPEMSRFVSSSASADSLAELMVAAFAQPQRLQADTQAVQQRATTTFSPEAHWRQLMEALA